MNSSNNYIMLKAKQNYLNKKSMPLDTNNNTILTQQNTITNETQEEAGFLEKGWETLVDVGGNFVGGVSKGVEGIVDYLIGTVAQGGSGVLSHVIVNLYDDNFKKSLQDIIEYDWTTEHILDPVSEWTQDSYINDASTKAQEIIRGIASGVGEIIPAAALTYATGGTNLVGTVAFGASAAGQATEQALNEDATMDEAMLYGTASGAVETGIEAISGGASKFFMGKGATSKFINKATSKIKSRTVKKIFKTGLETAGEGGEEVLSDIINPYLQRIYKEADEIEKPTLEDLGTSFLIGASVSLAYNGTIGKIGSRKKAIVENLDKLQNNKTDFNTKTTLTETDINEYQETMEDLNLDIEYDLKKLSAKTREKTISFLNEQGMKWFNTDGSIDYDKMQQGLELDLNYDIQEIANFDILQETKATTAQMQETKNLFNILKEQSNKLNDTKIFFDNSLPKNIEGFYNPQTKTIVINKNSKASYKTILKHELTHTLEGTKEYATLFDYSMKYLKERGEYETIRKELEKIYEKNLEKLDAQSKEKYTNEEMMSIFSERLFEDETSIKRITQENRSLIQKIYDWIKEKLSILTGKSKEEIELKKQLRKAEELFKKALMESNASNQEYMMLSNDEIKYGLKKSRYEIIDKYIMQKDHISLTINDKKINASIDENTLKKNFRLPINSTNAGFNAKVRNYQSFHEIIENSKYVESKPETNPQKNLYHNDIINWHIFRTNFADNLGTYDVITFISENTNHQYRIYESVWKKIKSPSQLSSNTATYGENNRLAKDSTTIIQNKEENINTFDEKKSKNAKFKLNSNGDELSPQQQEFFKDSKVRDDEGRLLVVYHGTSQDFTTFNIAKSRSYSGIVDYDLPGFYFTSDKNIASDYGKNAREYYLNITSPYEGDIYKLKQEQGTWRKVYDYLLDNNYDGFIEEEDGIIEYIAFEPNQIKSIDNLNPTTNDDIRFKKNDAESTNEETKVSRFQDKSVPKWAMREMFDAKTIETIEQMKTYYVPETDKATKEYIKTVLPNMNKDYTSYVDTYITNIENGLIRGKKDIGVGIALIEESLKRKDFANYSKLSINLTILGTELGQQVQAFNLLNNLTPKGELYYIQQYVKRFNAKTKNPNSKLKINQTYVEELKNVTTQEQKEQVVEKIIVDLAEQQPATLWEKITNWRYLAMLLNFKTHVRNIAGNSVMLGITKVKNTIARGIENNLIKRGKMLESQRVYAPQKYISLKVKEFAKNDTQLVLERLSSGSKFSEKGNNKNVTKAKVQNIAARIEDNRVIFNFKLFEKARKFNFSMLETEDFMYLKAHYQEALSQYLTARNIDVDTLNDPKNSQTLEKAREYAISVAQEATFRKFSYLAATLNNIKAKSKLHQMIIEGIVPFAKTPINILKTGINYSPVGLANAVFFQTRQLKNGNITINQYIDSLAKGLTGSMITALGYALSQLGLISIGADDEKENKYISDLGTQDYSLNVAGMSFTLDWISPASIPFFIGVAMQESFEKDGVANVEGIVGAIASSADPLTDLSMLSSLNSTLKTYSENRIGGMTKQIVKNFFAQMFPTALSQVAKTFDTKRRTTATTAKNEYGIGKEYAQYINYLKAKIPFLNNTLEPYINIWGQEETNPNFIENALENLAYPFWVSNSKVDSVVDNEIMSLYQQTGNKDVLPSTPNSYYTLDGVRHDLTPEEYTQYKKDFGTFSFNQLKVLFSSETYKNMSNEEKEKTIQTVYSYARDFSRKGKYFELFSALKTNGNQNNLSTFLVTIDNFTADLDENGNTIPNSRKKKVYNYINSLKLTRKQKILLFEFVGYSSSNISALSTNEKAKHPLLG